MISLTELFENTLNITYDNVGKDVSYKFVMDNGTLYIYFQGSDGETDWKYNFKFYKKLWWRKPYKGMENVFRVHAGFLECWKQVEDIVIERIKQDDVKEIVVSGYSHGAALAVLCHECCWFHRKDLIKEHKVHTFAFEAPRVIGAFKLKFLIRIRWADCVIFRNRNDIVTHVPPRIFGFTHPIALTYIGQNAHYGLGSFVKSHYPENVLASIKEFDEHEQARSESSSKH